MIMEIIDLSLILMTESIANVDILDELGDVKYVEDSYIDCLMDVVGFSSYHPAMDEELVNARSDR